MLQLIIYLLKRLWVSFKLRLIWGRWLHAFTGWRGESFPRFKNEWFTPAGRTWADSIKCFREEWHWSDQTSPPSRMEGWVRCKVACGTIGPALSNKTWDPSRAPALQLMLVSFSKEAGQQTSAWEAEKHQRVAIYSSPLHPLIPTPSTHPHSDDLPPCHPPTHSGHPHSNNSFPHNILIPIQKTHPHPICSSPPNLLIPTPSAHPHSTYSSPLQLLMT